MKNLIKLEELGMLIFGIYLLWLYQVPWGIYLLVILGPDISMLGYLAGNRAGAVSYNIFHHKGLALLSFLVGAYLHNDWMQVAGIILFAHSSMDRFMGYGLKYFDGFTSTHLGLIGNAKRSK
jgi:Domain of unknown function (DUF4260)